MNDKSGYPAQGGSFEAQLPDWFPRTRDTLRRDYAEIWTRFSSEPFPPAANLVLNLDCLTSEHLEGFTSDDQCERMVSEAAGRLGITVPIQVYLTENISDKGIRVYRDADQAQLIIQADLLSKINEQECLAIIGYELAKITLAAWDRGDLVHVERLLTRIHLQKEPHPVFIETLRLFQLYRKLFCDRGAWRVCGDLDAVNAAILFTETGEFPNRYEVTSKSEEQDRAHSDNEEPFTPDSSDAISRMVAAELWKQRSPTLDIDIAMKIQGPNSWKRLDVYRQSVAREKTRDLISTLLEPEWMRTDAKLAYAKLFFDDYKYQKPDHQGITDWLEISAKDVKEFVCFTMLDFITAERNLLEPALAYSLQLSARWKLLPLFIEMANRELRLRKTQIKEMADNTEQWIQIAADAHHKSVHRQDGGMPE